MVCDLSCPFSLRTEKDIIPIKSTSFLRRSVPRVQNIPILLVEIAHKSILDSPGAEKDIDLLFLINEISDCSHYNALLFDLYPKECRKNEPIVTDRFVR